uniref:TraD/TraG TraM recognition site domain-containing protein n=1 Tax=Cyanothece sp. (strain PCC 7425 / ATCC 29141) TaxID=395961 RepID=B8HZ08_CYAP4
MVKPVLQIDPNDPHNWGAALDGLMQSKYAKPLVLVAVLGIVWLVLAYRGKPKLKDSAAWATRDHVRRCRYLVAKQNIIGGKDNVGLELGSNLPLYDAVTSLISIGAPKTGKSFSAVLSALYAHLKLNYPAILVDVQYPVQTEQMVCLARQLGYAAEDIHIFAPGCPESGIWNICEYAQGSHAANLAKMLNDNFATSGSQGGDRFFDPAGEALISAVLQLARTIPGLNDVVGAQAILGLSELPKRVRLNEDRIDPWVYRAFMQLLSTEKSEKTAASIAGIASNLFKRFTEQDIAPALVGQTSFPLFLDGAKLLILGVRSDLREVIMPIQMALLSLLVDINSVPTRKKPLQICFDELAAATYRSLPSRINENRKYGVYFNLAFQNLSQLEEKYGKNLTTAILGACGTQILFNPREQQTAELISKIVGTQKYRESQRSRSVSGGKVSNSTSSQVKERPLIPPHQVRMMGQGWAIILNAGFRARDGSSEYIPYRCKIRVFEEYKQLTRWSASQWTHARKVFIQRSPQRPVDPAYLKAGVKLAEAVLSLPSTADLERQIADEALSGY